jgi:hypothetical protein
MTNDNVTNCGATANVSFESFSYCGALKENPKQISFVVLKSSEDVLKIFSTCQTFDVALPDFAQKRILGIYAGPKPTGGYAIKIQSVVEDGCQIVVEYFEKEPKKSDVVTTALTYPADYIVLPKSDKPILFKKVNEINDCIIIGSYFGQCIGADCLQFFKMNGQQVLHYSNVNYNSYDFDSYRFKSLIYNEDLAVFLQKIPAEITAIKGQTKTFGSPDSHDQGGVYFEWNQGGTVTRVYFDNDATADQSQSIILFKKIIQDKITELKTKQ